MKDDYILKIAEAIGKFSAKIFLNKDQNNEYENINLDSVSGGELLPMILKKLVLEGKYNEAENMLFQELHKLPSDDLVNMGRDFYSMLLSKSDEELAKGNFTREEIHQGLKDMEKLAGKHGEE